MKKKYQKLVADRQAKMNEIDALLGTAEKRDNKSFTTEEQTKYDGLMVEVRALKTQIDQTKELIDAQAEQELAAAEATRLNPTPHVRSLADPSVQGEFSGQQLADIQRFSYVRAIRLKLNDQALDGIEKEMHQLAVQQARDAGSAVEGNLGIPLVVMQRAGLTANAMRGVLPENEVRNLFAEQRAMTATGQTTSAGDQGGLAIQTNVGSIIERFYAKLLLKQMGCTVLDGLVGNVLFPRHVTDDQAAVKGENVASNVSSSKMSSLTLSPRRVPVVLEISRQFSMQTSPAIEAYLRDDLAFQVAKIIDQYGISGSGGGGQPYGILNTTGITTLYAGATVTYTNGVPAIALPVVGTNANGAAISFADTLALIKSLAIQNADIGRLGYMLNPQSKFALQLTPVIAGQASTYPEFVYPKTGDTMNGYRCGVTTQMPGNLTKGAGTNLSALLFGNFADALMGQWGGMDMLINPYSKDDQGLIRINAWSFFDFNIRRPLSFAAIQDAVTF